MPCRSWVGMVAVWVAVGVGPASFSRALADVNIELRTSPSVFRVGDIVSVELFAVSDSAVDQPFTGMDVVVMWDSTGLGLLGHVNDGPFAWTVADFLNDSGVDGLNADCGAMLFCDPFTRVPFNDGDAVFQAFSLVTAAPPIATPAGLLVTTLQFRVLTPLAATTIEIAEPALGDCLAGPTRVVGSDGERTLCLTGRVRPATVVLATCGSGGDFDGDCAIGLVDYALFPSCLFGPDIVTPCSTADLDGDGDGDLRDFSFVQSSHAGP